MAARRMSLPRAAKPEYDHLGERSVRMVASSRGRRPVRGAPKSSSHSRGLRPPSRQTSPWVRKALCENFKTECKPQIWSQQITWSQRPLRLPHAAFITRAQAHRRLPSNPLAQAHQPHATSNTLAQARLFLRTSTPLAQVRPTSFMLAQAILAPLSSTPRQTVFSTSARILTQIPA